MGGIAPRGRHAPLDVGIKRPRTLQSLMRGKDCLGVTGGKATPFLRRAGLHIDRPALRRARQVERTPYPVEFAIMTGRVNAVRIGKKTALLVGDDGIVFPAVPELRHHIDKFSRLTVTVGMWRMLLEIEVSGRRIGRGRHDVPAHPAAADVVNRSKQPREIIWLVISSGRRRNEADLFGDGRQGRQHGDRFQPVAGGIADIGIQHRRIGKENGIQLCRLGLAGDILIEPYISDAERLRLGVAPGCFMMSARIDECIENQLLGFSAHGDEPFLSLTRLRMKGEEAHASFVTHALARLPLRPSAPVA
ncbi:hypothetical protein AGR5A_Lc90046 [Agrobacterium genomosp. 5 str. CFBP 6626]|nr:hypothetical protein AGR5A_Lc90046 [Agrobacterium genomosp. 5 str. CFBP 6626]